MKLLRKLPAFGGKGILAICTLALTSAAFGQQTQCPYQVTAKYGAQGGHGDTLVFDALRIKLRTRAELEDAYNLTKSEFEEMKRDTSDTGFGSNSLPGGGLFGSANGRYEDTWSFEYIPYRGVDTITPVLRMYECHRAAGWPTAIDSGKGPASSKNASNNKPPQSAHGNNAQVDMSADVGNSPVQGTAFGNWESIATGKDAYRAQAASAASATSGPGARKRKRMNLAQINQCMQIVDAQRDHDLPDMYWFKIHNSCNMPIQAFWKSSIDVKYIDMLADIEAGHDSDKTWTQMPEGQPFRVKGIACPTKHFDADVHLDHLHNQCWAMD